MKYNLERLGWFNFERLTTTLLKKIIGPGISSFSGSPDQGRDATFEGEACFPSKDRVTKGRWIFQVKFRDYAGRELSEIRRELKDTLGKELQNVLFKHLFRCDVYVLVTNCPLTAENKDTLKGVIEANPRIGSGFVLGGQDIEELLDLNPRVVRAFPQIMGIGQLRELITWGINQRSIEYLTQVQEDLDTFVVTKPYLNALELLQRRHFCILTGAPKMGKTCTAGALAAAYASDGFSIHELRTQRDFYDVFEKGDKQVFICDDVFGDIALQTDKKDEWTRSVSRLLRALDKEHQLIWTARSYILTEALDTSKLLEDEPQIRDDEIVVSVEDLSEIEKAMILYNHAKKANLPASIRMIIKAECKRIVGSEYFAPESIRQLCTGKITEIAGDITDKKAVVDRIMEFLKSPGNAWKRAFRSAPSEVQFLCIQVMAQGGTMPYGRLISCYEMEVSWKGLKWTSFGESFAWAEGTFLKRKQGFGDVHVSFYHPSMRDLLLELIQNDASVRKAYISKLSLEEFIRVATSSDSRSTEPQPSQQMISQIEGDDATAVLQYLRERIIPTLTLKDANILLSAFAAAMNKYTFRNLSEVGKTALREIIHAVSIRAFWEANQRTAEMEKLNEWRTFFDLYEQAVARSDIDRIPEFIRDALTSLKNAEEVSYWELVAACQRLSLAVTLKYADVMERAVCRKKLTHVLQYAIDSCSDGFHDDHDACNSWHDEYDFLLPKCRAYVQAFPDDSLAGLEELETLFDEYPSVEPDYPYDRDDLDTMRGSDLDISHIFADL